ncbi:MAG: cysteine synthase A [Bacteroidetes bacterium]|nr:cysteine synthase A [Bacteroidota bacterium]MBU1720810.1 cysteine synthase A [Bacteroidota bacterium]
MNIADNILQLIGSTPLVYLKQVVEPGYARIAVKLESQNPGGSVKDRVALNMIGVAEHMGLISRDTVIIEPTSGNTGIGLAMVCAVKKYRLILVMPESMSIERRTILKSYGAEIVLTPAAGGMQAAVNKAEEMQWDILGAFMPMQFANTANPAVHIATTAEEIWRDTDGKVDIFVAGVGTGGTISGVGQVLKSRKPKVQIVAVEPEDSPVISGGKPGPHKIQGIGAGFIPDNFDDTFVDRVMLMKNDEAIAMTKRLAAEEGILCGISSGANVAAALKIAAQPIHAGKLIVTVICDTGERYLSTGIFD